MSLTKGTLYFDTTELMKEAKKCNVDMVDLLHGKISITEVAV